MKHLKTFEKYYDLNDEFASETDGVAPQMHLPDEFEKLAQSALEYFASDDEIDLDVRSFDDLPFGDKDLDDHSNLLKDILNRHGLDLESYDDESVVIVKL